MLGEDESLSVAAGRKASECPMISVNGRQRGMKPRLCSGSLGIIETEYLLAVSSPSLGNTFQADTGTLSSRFMEGHLKVNTTNTSTNIVDSAKP